MATIYSHYSDAQLYELFRAENWHSEKMNDIQRQQALQELSDRDALSNGTRKCPVEVTGQTDPYGAFHPGTGKISFNDEFVNKGTNCLDDDHPPIPAANLRAMNTVYHENEHVRQHEMVDRPAREGDDLQLRSDLTANFHGFNYIQPGYDYDLYRIQICEKDANEVGDAKTMAAMKELEAQHNGQTDPNMKYYAGSVSRSYQDSLENARIRYDDPHVEQTLQRAMNDNAFGNRVVAQNQGSSYYDIRSLMAQQEIDAYRGYIAEHPELDQERLDEFQQVIQDRTDEMDALDKAWEQSEANPDALSPGSSEADAAPSQAESPSESEGCSDSDDDGMSIGM